MVKGFCLLIERDNGFHDLWVVVPVLILKEVTCEFVNFHLTSSLSKSYNSLDLSTFNETFNTLQWLVSHGIDLSA
jgi:hypothetical protein